MLDKIDYEIIDKYFNDQLTKEENVFLLGRLTDKAFKEELLERAQAVDALTEIERIRFISFLNS